MVTRPVPDGYTAMIQGAPGSVEDPIAPPDCSQSNWAAGMDMVFMLLSGISSIALASEAAGPPPMNAPDERSSDAGGAVATGALAILTGYSMVRGFSRSRECREATEAAGYPSHGGSDWLLTIAVVLTIGAAALSHAGSYDPDACSPGAVVTALCRDGWRSCSLHRQGTCSRHGGVAEWL